MDTVVINNITWKHISLTHVEYPVGDIFGGVLAWMSLVPVFIIVGFITLIFSRPDLHTILFFIGQLCNEIINYTLKKVIAHPRPARNRSERLFSEHGMPSSHAQFMSFFIVYLSLFLFIRLHHHSGQLVRHKIWKYSVWLTFSVSTILVFISRVYLLYHTINQVIVGAVVGSINGLVWFSMVHLLLSPFFPSIAAWSVCELLMIRDASLIPNCLLFEYYSYRTEARNRLRRVQ